MSRTNLYLKNNSGETLEFSVPPCEPDRFYGSDWEAIPKKGIKILPNEKKLLGSIGDPGSNESNHWGWIYLYSEKHDDYIQCYMISKGDKASGNVAAFDWYDGKKIDDSCTNLSGKSLGNVTKDKNDDFCLGYHPAEDYDKKPAKPKLDFDVKVNAELIETFSHDPKTGTLHRTNSYSISVRVGPNKLQSGHARLSAPYPVTIGLGGDLAVTNAKRTANIGLNLPFMLNVSNSGSCFTITMPVTTIAATVLYLDFINPSNPVHPHRIVINPPELVLQNLTQLGNDANSIGKALRDKTSGRRDTQSIEAASKMINQLIGIERRLETVPKMDGFVYVELQGAAVTLGRDTSLHKLRDCCFGISIEGAAARYFVDDDARNKIEECKQRCKEHGIDSSTLHMFDGFWDRLNDSFKAIKEFFVKVIDNVINVIVRIGDAIYSVVMTIASEAIKAIGWVLENVLGITMDDVVEWLGYVFDWNTIRKTQQYIKHNFDCGFQLLLQQRQVAKDKVGEFRELAIQELGLEKYENKLRFKTGALENLQSRFNGIRGQYNLDQYRQSSETMTIGDKQFNSDAPELRWAMDNLTLDGGNLNSHTTFSDLGTKVQQLFQRLMDDSQAFLPDIKATADLVAGYFENVTFETLLDAMINAVGQIATGLIHLLEHTMDLLIDLIFGLIELLHDVLCISVPFPFIGALYKKYIDQSVESPNLIEVMSLIASIPVAVISNLFSHSPFKSLPEDNSSFSGTTKFRAMNFAASADVNPALTRTAMSPADQEEQTRLGVISGAYQIISSFLYGGMEFHWITQSPLVPIFLTFKLASDTINYTVSTASMAKYIKANRNDKLTHRQNLDIALAALMVVPRITDFVRLSTFLSGTIMGKDIREKCGILDTCFSAFAIIALIADLCLQSDELKSSQTPNEDRIKLALKGTQLSLSMLNGLLAWPREKLSGTGPEYEAPMALLRGFVQFSNGVFVITRTYYNASLLPPYQPRHHLNGPIYS